MIASGSFQEKRFAEFAPCNKTDIIVSSERASSIRRLPQVVSVFPFCKGFGACPGPCGKRTAERQFYPRGHWNAILLTLRSFSFYEDMFVRNMPSDYLNACKRSGLRVPGSSM
jgi:hypothetical protein